MRRALFFLVCLHFMAPLCLALRLEEQLPFRGDVSEQWIAVSEGGNIKLIKADLQKTPEKLILSTEVEKLKSKAIVAGIVRFSNGEVVSSNFRSYVQGNESNNSQSSSEELGELTDKLQSAKLELTKLEGEVKLAGADLRKRAGLGEVDAIYLKIELLNAKIEELKAKETE